MLLARTLLQFKQRSHVVYTELMGGCMYVSQTLSLYLLYSFKLRLNSEVSISKLLRLTSSTNAGCSSTDESSWFWLNFFRSSILLFAASVSNSRSNWSFELCSTAFSIVGWFVLSGRGLDLGGRKLYDWLYFSFLFKDFSPNERILNGIEDWFGRVDDEWAVYFRSCFGGERTIFLKSFKTL